MRRTVMALIAAGMLFATACGQGDDDVAAGRDSDAPATEPASATRRPTQETTTTTAPPTTTITVGGDDEPASPPGSPCGGATEAAAPAAGTTQAAQAAPASLDAGGIQGIRMRPADAPPECTGPAPDPEPALGTGDVQVTLRWQSSADLDLHVTEPDGTEIWYQAPGPSETGGQLDVDSNVGCQQEASVENIFWPTGEAPSGRYTVEVVGFQVDDCGSGSYMVTGKVQGEDVLIEGGAVGEDETDTFTIDV